MVPLGNRTTKVAALELLVAVAAGISLFGTRPWESATERAHRICAECGLSTDETDQLIDGVRHSTLTQDENLQLFYDMF